MKKTIIASIDTIKKELDNILIENKELEEKSVELNKSKKKIENLKNFSLANRIDYNLIWKIIKSQEYNFIGLKHYNSKVCNKRKLSIEEWNELFELLDYKIFKIQKEEMK